MANRVGIMHRVSCFTRIVVLAGSALLLFIINFSVVAGTQAERVLDIIRDMRASGELSGNPVLRLTVKKGNISNFKGKNFALKTAWEEQTGVLLDFRVMPQVPSLAFIRDANDVDVTIARNREFPELQAENLLTDLSPLLEKFGLELNEASEDGYINPSKQVVIGGSIVGIPADNDIAMLYLRSDLLEDNRNQVEFIQRYKRALRPPQTWSEYLQLLEFFHKPGEGFYGSLEPREQSTAWMYWMPRYLSKGNPTQLLFDDEMHPLIDGVQGIAATQEYIDTVQYSPDDILKSGNDYSYTLPRFRSGKGFSTIITAAGSKIFNGKTSAVRGRYKTYPMPGTRLGEKLIRRTTYIYGNNIVIPRTSPNPELAFLYSMWLTDPDNSRDSVSVSGGFSDPYRHNHIKDSEIRKVYSEQVVDMLSREASIAVPAGTGLPGDSEYIEVLNRNLWRAAAGEVSAAQAMAATAEAWELITERHGRESQIARWKAFKVLCPDELGITLEKPVAGMK
jgi:multiple sugar transport system substrate-binding protein